MNTGAMFIPIDRYLFQLSYTLQGGRSGASRKANRMRHMQTYAILMAVCLLNDQIGLRKAAIHRSDKHGLNFIAFGYKVCLLKRIGHSVYAPASTNETAFMHLPLYLAPTGLDNCYSPFGAKCVSHADRF